MGARHAAKRISMWAVWHFRIFVQCFLRRLWYVPYVGDERHLDEVFLKINGRLHYLRRAMDQDSDVLDVLVQSRRDKEAVKKFLCKLRY